MVLEAKLRTKCAGRGTEVLLHVAGEVALRGEAVHVGNVGQREALVARQASDVDGGVSVDPEVGRVAAHLAAHLREILGRDAEFVGIIAHLTAAAVVAPLLLGQAKTTALFWQNIGVETAKQRRCFLGIIIGNDL